MTKAGCLLIMIMFIIESFFIIPLLWTIPSFLAIGRINKNKGTVNDKILVSVLGIIFGAFFGIIGGVLILVDINGNSNNDSQ